ncbi:mucin-5AC isoform X7 [Drosophila subobscura]|nr:mucin-5AC isoform X7 [Drosophila subobscura]
MKTAYKGFKTKLRENGNQLGGTNFHFGLGSPTHSDRPDGGSGGYVRSGRGLGAAHHSAPSSPVTSKRLDNGIGGTHGAGAITGTGSSHTNGSLAREPREYGARRGPVPLAMSSSSSHIQPNGHAYGAHAAAHYGHHLAASPAVSSASSLCSSSEMNLSQELQNHPLFKTPAVDRSLKPSSEHHTTRTQRGGAPPARPPPPQSMQPTQPASAFYYNHPYATHQHVETKPPRHTSTPTKPRQPLPTTDSSFDSPPDVQSPPIPPRRQCGSNAVAATAAAVSAEISKLERNCWQDEPAATNNSVRNSNASSTTSTSSSCSSGASFVTAASTFSHLNVSDPPIPTPRAKREQSQQQHHHHHHQPLEDSMNDLISLDDSNNTSFDLEDFDPLNQNARPMPPLGKVFNKKSCTLPAGVNSSVVTAASSGNSVSNPLYPYFAPKHMATVAAVTGGRAPPLPPQIQRNTIAARPDDDFELLRKYGLDQFTLNANAAEKQHQQQKPAIITAGSAAGKGMNNWTTFD